MSKTLALIPFLMIGGWLVVAASPALATLIAVQIIRRAGNYAITRPGREMLFTLVDSETRFKSKPVIDTVVYRGSDVATAWFYTKLVSAFGLGLAGIAVVGAVVAAAWVATAVHLGRMFEQMETGDSESGSTE